MTTSTKILTAAVLCATGFAWAQTWRLSRERSRSREEKASLQQKILASWQEGHQASQGDMAVLVAGLRLQLEEAKNAKAPIVVAGRTITKEVPFAVDCPQQDSAPPTLDSRASTTPASTTSLGGALAFFTVRNEFAVAALDDGSLSWSGVTFGTLRQGERVVTQQLPVNETTIAFDKRLKDAWAEKVAGPRRLLEFRALLVGPTWGIRAGTTYIPKGSHVGFAADVEQTWDDQTRCAYSPYYETTQCSEVSAKDRAYGVGVALRF